MRNPDYLDDLRNMDKYQQELYEKTYEAYLDNRNYDVHKAYETINEKYPLSKTLPKFMFLHALAYVTERDKEKFNTTLRELLDRYPDTDITPVASAWLKGMAQGRELQAGIGTNLRGMIWDISLGNDSASVAADGKAQFELNEEVPQRLVFTFPTDKVSSNELLFAIARHNFRSFVVKDYDLEQMNFGRLGMVIVSGFANQAELNHYRSVMAASDDFRLPAGVRPIAISDANFKILLEQGRSFEEYFRYLDEQNYIDAQADILAPDEIETLEEAEEAEAAEGLPDTYAVPDSDAAIDAGADAEAEAVVDGPEADITRPAPQVPQLPLTAPQQPQEKPIPQPAPKIPTTPKSPVKSPVTAPAKSPEQPAKPEPAPFLPGSEGEDDPLLEDF